MTLTTVHNVKSIINDSMRGAIVRELEAAIPELADEIVNRVRKAVFGEALHLVDGHLFVMPDGETHLEIRVGERDK